MGRAKDFFSNFVLKTAGILCVFQGFYKQKLGKKIRPEREKELLEVPPIKTASVSSRDRGGLCGTTLVPLAGHSKRDNGREPALPTDFCSEGCYRVIFPRHVTVSQRPTALCTQRTWYSSLSLQLSI